MKDCQPNYMRKRKHIFQCCLPLINQFFDDFFSEKIYSDERI